MNDFDRETPLPPVILTNGLTMDTSRFDVSFFFLEIVVFTFAIMKLIPSKKITKNTKDALHQKVQGARISWKVNQPKIPLQTGNGARGAS